MGASKATAKRETLAKGREWCNQRHQKTDDGNAGKKAAAAAEKDAVATPGANVEDLKEARHAVSPRGRVRAISPRQTTKRTSATQVTHLGRVPGGRCSVAS